MEHINIIRLTNISMYIYQGSMDHYNNWYWFEYNQNSWLFIINHSLEKIFEKTTFFMYSKLTIQEQKCYLKISLKIYVEMLVHFWSWNTIHKVLFEKIINLFRDREKLLLMTRRKIIKIHFITRRANNFFFCHWANNLFVYKECLDNCM